MNISFEGGGGGGRRGEAFSGSTPGPALTLSDFARQSYAAELWSREWGGGGEVETFPFLVLSG